MHEYYSIIMIVVGVFLLFYISNKFLILFNEINNDKYLKCCIAVKVSLDMEKILKTPPFLQDDNLLLKFNSIYKDPNLDPNWHRIIFVIKDNLVFVNGNLTPYAGYSISLPNDKKPDEPFKIIVGLRDSDLVVNYYEPDILSKHIIACLPLAYVAYKYNYHPQYLSQVYYSEDHPEFGTKEKDREIKKEYDDLRKLIVDGKENKRLESKFAALKDSLLEKNGFKEIGDNQNIRETDYYYNEKAGVGVEIYQLDHGL